MENNKSKFGNELKIPFSGSIPLEPKIVGFSDEGNPFVDLDLRIGNKKKSEEIVGKIIKITQAER